MYKNYLTSLFASIFLDIPLSNRRTHSYNKNNLFGTQNLLKKCIFIVFADQMIKIKTPEVKWFGQDHTTGTLQFWDEEPRLCLNPMFFLLDSVALFKTTYGIGIASQESHFNKYSINLFIEYLVNKY